MKILTTVVLFFVLQAAQAQLDLSGPLQGTEGEITGPYCAAIPNGETPFAVSWSITNGSRHSGSADCAFVIWDAGATSGTIRFQSGSHGNSETLTVQIKPAQPVPGVPVANDQERCDAGPLTLTVSGGGDDVLGYRWYNVPTGGTALHEGTTHTTTGLAWGQTTSFWVSAYNASGEGGRDPVTARIHLSMSAGAIASPVDEVICANTSPGTIHVTQNPSGNGPFSYQWEYAYDGQTWQSAGATSSTYTPPALDRDTYFRRVDRDECNRSAATNSIYIQTAKVSGPTLSAYQFETCAGEGLTISIASTGASDSFEWTLGESTLTGTTILFLPLNAGEYPGTLTGYDSNTGCQSETVPFTVQVFEQCDFDKNYVKVVELLSPGYASRQEARVFDRARQNQVKTYVNGLGLPIQQVLRQHSPNLSNDVVTLSTYDNFLRKSRQYLPYVAESDRGDFAEDADGATERFYETAKDVAHDSRPYALTKYEPFPHNRVVEQGAPGTDWQPGSGHTVRRTFGNNIASDQLMRWEVVDNTLTLIRYFDGPELLKTRTWDEYDRQTLEFKDRMGNVVLKRVQVDASTTTWADTYYVYDDLGNLRYVLPPEALREIGSPTVPYAPSPSLLAEWAFQYVYDGQKRMTEKTVPGAKTIYMVYDERDRLVLTQDGNQRDPEIGTGREWRFTKYDALNRPVATGMYTHSSAVDQAAMQTYVNSRFGDEDEWSETLSLAGGFHGYTNQAFPTAVTAEDYLTVTYYDTYDFKTPEDYGTKFNYAKPGISAGGITTPQGTYDYAGAAFGHVIGQVTGNKVKVLDTEQWIKTVTYYDDRYRVVQMVTEHEYHATLERISNVYTFTGWLLETFKEMTRDGNRLGLRNRYTYDHTGRLQAGYHELYGNGVGQGEVFLAENKYNALGELIEKNLHVENGAPAQSIDFRYTIRGWLESINSANRLQGPQNDDTDQPEDFFGMELRYQTPLPGVGVPDTDPWN